MSDEENKIPDASPPEQPSEPVAEKTAEEAIEAKPGSKIEPSVEPSAELAPAKQAKSKPKVTASKPAAKKKVAKKAPPTPHEPKHPKPLQLGKTFQVAEKTRDRKWYILDAKGQRLGRLCCEIVRLLAGKRKPDYTKHCDSGDFVVVINAKEITYTGKRKADQTKYYSYSGYPGGLREESLGDLLERIPEKVILNTVNGMLPKATNRRSILLKKLKVYAGAVHPHSAQKPTLIKSLPNL
ncbi:MAG: 50S ribosomal protein L13 [Candidatus Caenarcaniphilales bacterium]|nr:50S ribosomal protein L13 [Candidatus Caenarcaniphilales bacterium]